MGSAKRNKFEIINSILSVIKVRSGSCKPTTILVKANLSQNMMLVYLDDLLLNGLISFRPVNSKRIVYDLTDKGYNYLQDYKQVKVFMSNYGIKL